MFQHYLVLICAEIKYTHRVHCDGSIERIKLLFIMENQIKQIFFCIS